MPRCVDCDLYDAADKGRARAMHRRNKHQGETDLELMPHKNAADPLERMNKEELLEFARKLLAQPLEATVATPPQPLTEDVASLAPSGPERYIPRQAGELEPALISEDERKKNAQQQMAMPRQVQPQAGLQPGEYVVIGRDRQGNESYVKVGHTKEWFEQNYPMVDFEPARSKNFNINGIHFSLIANQVNRVPSIVRDLYRDWQRELFLEDNRYPLLSADEEARITQGAMKNKMAFSRVFKTGAFEGWDSEEAANAEPVAPVSNAGVVAQPQA